MVTTGYFIAAMLYVALSALLFGMIAGAVIVIALHEKNREHEPEMSVRVSDDVRKTWQEIQEKLQQQTGGK